MFVSADVVFFSLPGSPSPNQRPCRREERSKGQLKELFGGDTDHGLAADALR